MPKLKIQVNKANKSYEFDFAKLPAASREYIIGYGMKQTMNDVCAMPNLTRAKYIELADKRAKALRAGEPPKSGGGVKVAPTVREFAKRVKAQLEKGIEMNASQIAIAITQDKLTRKDIGMKLAVRHMGNKANAAKAKAFEEALWAKAAKAVKREAEARDEDADVLAAIAKA